MQSMQEPIDPSGDNSTPSEKTPRIKHVPDRDNVGSLLLAFRQRAKLTQKQAAHLLNVNPTSIAQWEVNFKRPQPWALDMMQKAYGLNEFEGFLLFYEAGYALFDTPPAIIALLKTYAELPPDWQPVADQLLGASVSVLEQWRLRSRQVGLEPQRRRIPTVNEMDGYWDERRLSRYHSKRVERRVRATPGPVATPD